MHASVTIDLEYTDGRPRQRLVTTMNDNYGDEATWNQKDYDAAKKLLLRSSKMRIAKDFSITHREATCYELDNSKLWETYCFDAHLELDLKVFFSSPQNTHE